MKALLLFLLYAGLFEFRFARDRLQTFRSLNGYVSLKNAEENCTSTNESLITLFDREHVDVVSNAPCSLDSLGFWVGLKEKENISSTWSDGTEVTFNKSSVTVGRDQQICEALDNGQWKGFNCSERKFFLCSTDQGYVLIQSQKDWCQALQYCKKVHKGLATINSTEYNDLAHKTSKGLPVWIGLMHDQWEWPNKECSLFRKWAPTFPDGNFVFLQKEMNQGVLYEAESTIEKCALCSKGKVRIKVIKHNSSWDEALTYCETMHSRLLWIENQSDQEAVSTWLNHSSFDTSTPGSLWIGLRQSVFGFWIWSDRMVNWNNWKEGTVPEKSPFNHCGVIDREDFTWRNEDCDQKLPFLCEEDIVDFN